LEVEAHGVDQIPERERTATAGSVVWILVGGNLAFSVVVFGWLPLTFGLSFWSAITSLAVGVALGTVVTAPLALLGPRTGTNNSVSSGADFGVVGRLIGSCLSLLFALGYLALAVWAGADAVVAGAHRLIGTPLSDASLAVGYAVTAILVAVVSVYGYRLFVATQKLLVPVAGVLLLGSLVALGPQIDLSHGGGSYVLGGFWKTWALAVTVAATGPISYAPYLGDWTRYVSRRRFSDRQVMSAATVGLFVSSFLPAVIGAATATAFTNINAPYVESLVAASPMWYLVPIVICGVIATVGQGAIGLYGTGLDLEAIIPRLRRSVATVINSVIGVALIFLGTFAFSAQDSITAFVILLTTITTPWMAVILVGFVRRRGSYQPDDLQVFNRREKGGVYWYTRGWHLSAVAAWAVGSVVGLMFTSSTLVTGPFAGAAGGVDLSFTSAGVVAAVAYIALQRLERTLSNRPGIAATSVEPLLQPAAPHWQPLTNDSPGEGHVS
jgi:purine-cytosine permease-like protein